MKTVFKILCVIFALAFIGNLTAGKIFFAGLGLAILFGVLGWKDSSKEEKAAD